MSSSPGVTLEDYLGWVLNIDPECEAMAQIAPLFEQWRERVEDILMEFDDEEQSWRGFAAYAFDFIPDPPHDEAFSILRGTHSL